eukprot:Skav220544  [mRNA]  locus=scaffold761:54507:55215:+ [translate_table: standard]
MQPDLPELQRTRPPPCLRPRNGARMHELVIMAVELEIMQQARITLAKSPGS